MIEGVKVILTMYVPFILVMGFLARVLYVAERRVEMRSKRVEIEWQEKQMW